MRQILIHDGPDRCVIGTVGAAGQRTFFLQARTGRRTNTVALEKEQARLLGERLDSLMTELVAEELIDAADAVADPALIDDGPLETPIEEDFRVGVLGIGWNPGTHRLLIEAFAFDPEDGDTPDLESDEPEGPDTLRIRLDVAAGREFARRALAVVSAGRPLCPFCQLPLDPDGHICPRANGYRR